MTRRCIAASVPDRKNTVLGVHCTYATEDKEMYADVEELRRVGLDYWMPVAFSGYQKEAHMHQYYQTLRTLYVTEKMRAWWTTGDHRFLGLRTDDLILECAQKIPQLVFNTQFIGVNDDELLKYHLVLVRHYHSIMPSHVAFWFIGATSPTFTHNVRAVSGTRDLYFLSAKPLYLASKGQELQPTGKHKPSKLPKWDLLQENIKSFSSMIKNYG